MKKILILSVLLLNFLGCSSPDKEAEPVIDADDLTYSNSYYGFSLSYPASDSYCLNDLCYNQIPEDAISAFNLMDYSVGNVPVMIIQPYTNGLTGSVTTFAQNSLELNKEFGTNDYHYSNAEETAFAGQPAFTFDAENGFEERGSTIDTTEDGHILLKETNQDPGRLNALVAFNGTYKVFYVTHGNMIFRILASDDKSTQNILKTFSFQE